MRKLTPEERIQRNAAKTAKAMERYWADPEKARERVRLLARRRRVKSIKGAPETRPPADAVCEICGQIPKKMCLDHCHTSQTFRGWLCEACNFGLGNYKDSPELLERAAEYLRRFNSQSEAPASASAATGRESQTASTALTTAAWSEGVHPEA